MQKVIPLLFTFLLILFIGTSFSKPVSANAPIKGTFVAVNYEDVQVDAKTTEKRLKSITIKNSVGKTIILNIDKFTYLFVDNVSVKIEAFKAGMEIEVDVNLRRVKEIRGQTGTEPAQIEHRDKIVIGTVSNLASNGKSISVKLDNGQSQTYAIRSTTEVFKGTTLVDLSVVYEGDRVKLVFSAYDTNTISSIEVIAQGTKIDGLYKGTIQRIDPVGHKLILKDEQVFKDWKWTAHTIQSNSSYSYSSKIPIYVGDKLIKPDQLRYYANNEVYFVTVSQFGKAVIEKMVIKQKYERTYTESMTFANIASKRIGLQKAGSVRYHDGTILIRNGRLVDTASLQAYGTAFVVTDGLKSIEFANVIHIANDGFQSPNLAEHALYYGQLSSTNSYEVTLQNAKLLSNNYWKDVKNPTLSFSNDTFAVEDFRNSTLKVVARDEMIDHTRKGEYGYFYVSNGHIVALHLLDKKAPLANLVSVGRLDAINNSIPNIIRVRNVSQWQNGSWAEVGNIYQMNIEQATLIKDGKVISVKELKTDDRLFILHESQVKGRILLVN